MMELVHLGHFVSAAKHWQQLCPLQVLQQLDGEGKARVVKLLKELPKSSVLVVGQADSFVTQHAACVHVVKKQHGRASVVISQ